jgi:hypothetical protein
VPGACSAVAGASTYSAICVTDQRSLWRRSSPQIAGRFRRNLSSPDVGAGTPARGTARFQAPSEPRRRSPQACTPTGARLGDDHISWWPSGGRCSRNAHEQRRIREHGPTPSGTAGRQTGWSGVLSMIG